METFLIKEHKEQGHSFTENCPQCYSESEVLTGMESDFSFENVIKMVGNINKVLYGVNGFTKEK